MEKKSKRKSLSLTLRNYFITGVVVLIPIGFTLYLSKILIGISSNLIPKNLNPNHYLPFDIPGVEILISILLITVVGGLSLSFFGRRILKLIDDLFKRIPFLRTVYSAIVQMTETFSKKDDNKKSVVLIEARVSLSSLIFSFSLIFSYISAACAFNLASGMIFNCFLSVIGAVVQ